MARGAAAGVVFPDRDLVCRTNGRRSTLVYDLAVVQTAVDASCKTWLASGDGAAADRMAGATATSMDRTAVGESTIMSVVRIGSRLVGEGQSTLIVAEIGINHNGNLDLAKRLIEAAAGAGCDAVQFQKRTVDAVDTAEELRRPRESPFGTTNGDLKRGLELGRDAYAEIDRLCRRLGLLWFASCWDAASVDFLEQFDPPCHKIASPGLTDDELL